jgi:MFS family permease
VQGLLAAVAVVAKRTYFVDVFSGDRLEHYLSSFTIVWSMGPIVAPFIGGYLQNSFGWQANFIFLAGFAWIALLLELWVSGETLKHPQAFEPRNTLRQYREMLSHGPFIRGLVNLSLPYSAIMAYSMAAPFIIEHVYHMDSKTTGYASLAMGLAWMVGGFVAKSQHHRTTSYKHGKAVQVMFAMVLIMLSTSFYISNIYTLVLFAFVIHATCGMLFNIYFTECLSMFPRQAGLSGGLTGGVAFMLTSILSYGAITVFSVNIQLRLAVVYLVFAGLSALMLRWKTVYRCDVDVARNEVNRVSVELS